jgi:phenylacetate-CoA ligase
MNQKFYRTFSDYFIYSTQNIIISTKGVIVKKIKYGKEFSEILRHLENSQWLTKDEIYAMQNAKLRKIIDHAYKNVKYYNQIFKKNDLVPSDIQTTDDLYKIPVLTKDALRANKQELLAKNYSKGLLSAGWTTGSTGTPINALRTPYSIIFESAMIWRQRKWGGVNVNSRRAAVWGTIWDKVIVPYNRNRPPYWRINASEKQLLLSYYHISNDTLPVYFRQFDKFQPEFIEGFPSIILTLAKYLKRKNKFFPLKAIFTSSEPLYDLHRKEIEERFQTKIFDLYGQAERVAAATECSEHQGYHENPEYGIIEIIKGDKPVSDGEVGEIIATGLNNYAMPLIRYQTGDLTVRSDKRCLCGRQMPLLQKIEGRKADRIITSDGRIIPGAGIMGAFHGISNIKKSQVVQETLNDIVIKIEKNDSNKSVNLEKLRFNLQKCIGDGIRISFDVGTSVINKNTIKHRWVISKIKMDDY